MYDRFPRRIIIARSFAVAAVSLGALAGCVASPPYECTSSVQCTSPGGTQGVCLPSAHCAYPDPSCGVLGLRHSEDASSDLASACVTPSASDDCLVQVATGIEFSCAVKTDGSVWCWGANDHGQAGDGGPVGEPRPTPVKVALPADVRATSVGCGEVHACALGSDGRVFCWGGGDSLQLGLGSADATDHSTPVEVTFPGSRGSIRDLSVGAAHTCAIESETVWCWGENDHEECGQRVDAPCPGSTDPVGVCEDVPVPTPIADLQANHVVSGDEFTCAIDDLNELWCWGDNSLAELGVGRFDVTGGANSRQTPVPQKTGSGSFLTLDTSGGVPFFAAGAEHACAVVGGSVSCWGSNGSGQVGRGTKSAGEPTPQIVASARDIEIGCMAKHTCSIDGMGSLACWGNNSDGQIGVGTTEDALVPALVPLVGVRQAALGDRHSCALTAAGALYCWGANDKGQLGLPISSALLTPTLSGASAAICR